MLTSTPEINTLPYTPLFRSLCAEKRLDGHLQEIK
eukprot:gene18093-23325_t